MKQQQLQQDSSVPFSKMEGLGNDYIFILETDLPRRYTDEELCAMAKHASSRHFGVGSDGLVLIGASEKADFRMRIFNSDGSEAEMCGNALRCVGKYAYDKGLTQKKELAVETLAGIRILELRTVHDVVQSVRVAMGVPQLNPADIPMSVEGESFINRVIAVGGKDYWGTALSMGNPHLVVPVGNPKALDLQQLGPKFEHHPLFPARVNTEFVKVASRTHIHMRVWERGAGETLACGTGACAAAVACALNGLSDRDVTVHLPGGKLHIVWAADGMVYKTGPAHHVYDGDYDLPVSLVSCV